MGILKDLSKAAFSRTAKAALERTGRRAKKLSGEALETLDQFGGRARDSAQSYWQQTAPWRERVSSQLAERLGGNDDNDSGDESPTDRARVESEPEEREPERVGNPEIPLQLFIRSSCPSCHRAQRLLEDAGIDATVTAIDEQVNAHYVRALLVETERATVPYVFIRGEYIGGYDELEQLQRLGQLEARLVAPARGRR